MWAVSPGFCGFSLIFISFLLVRGVVSRYWCELAHHWILQKAGM